ncbi:resistin-like beta [Hyperolius riggenbachi]|uniref:resistin-like beta n=1 Tax=Hyperolius riggenbachi TaxID=752182 RepID=UPI0035A3778A
MLGTQAELTILVGDREVVSLRCVLYKMKLFLSLMSMFLVAGVTQAGVGDCTVNDVLTLNNLIKSLGCTSSDGGNLVCVDVNQQSGAYAACPSGYTLTGCSCGMACGSWDVQNNNTCHCRCANIDWTSARCCKFAR